MRARADGTGPRGATIAALALVAALAAPAALAQTPVPPPVAGKTVNLKLLIAPVSYKVPGATKFVPLSGEVQVPVGTTINTDMGRVNITSASDLQGGTNKSWFYDGTFSVDQAVSSKPVTELAIAPIDCKAGAAAASAKKVTRRKLWGQGSGSFRTRGQFSSATVRGTKWVVIDECDRTITRVVRGVVAVRDFRRKKTILLRAGEQYLAKKQ